MWGIMPERASSYAADIDNVIMLITYTVGGWLIACYVVFFAFLFLYRRRDGRPPKYVPGTGKQMAWVLVPVLFVVFFDLAIDIYNAPVWSRVKEDIPKTEQVVHVLARQWSWQFTYPGPDGKMNTPDDKVTINELHIKVNTKTKFVLTAADVLHSFSIPAFRLKQDAIPGRRISGWFEAVRPGTYDIQCAEICGAGHSVMAARAIVHSAADFEKALAAAAARAPGRQATVAAAAARAPGRQATVAAARLESAFVSRKN